LYSAIQLSAATVYETQCAMFAVNDVELDTDTMRSNKHSM